MLETASQLLNHISINNQLESQVIPTFTLPHYIKLNIELTFLENSIYFS